MYLRDNKLEHIKFAIKNVGKHHFVREPRKFFVYSDFIQFQSFNGLFNYEVDVHGFSGTHVPRASTYRWSLPATNLACHRRQYKHKHSHVRRFNEILVGIKIN